MKRILICLLSIISVSNERNFKLTSAHPGERGFTVNHYESIVQDTSHKEQSLLHDSEALDITKKILVENDGAESLLPSKAITDDSRYYDNNAISDVPNADESLVLASTAATDEITDFINNDHSENVNESKQFNSYQNQEYVSSTESQIQGQTPEANASGKLINKNESVDITGQEPQVQEIESKKSSPQHEDIPSFSEWTQKQLAQAEKKKLDQNETTERITKGRGKFRTKNYASPDCGAKIVAANPESVSSSSVLSSLKDEYMLNYCTNRIWFIVELCEAIQAKQLDLANFELFSSSPKHFSVFVSHRFPTREWSNVGKFTAEDSRDVQTFNLNPHLFGKFIKVEMHSHYGREQFCPISWVGVYGTSEYEVLAKEDEKNLLNEDDYGDSFDEEIFLGHKRNSPKNLFSSATEAVLSIVKKATAPFMKSENNETESKNCSRATNSVNSKCISPRYIVVCNNCSQSYYDEVYRYLSCQYDQLDHLTSSPFVRHALIHGNPCTTLGLDFSDVKKGAPYPLNFLRTSEQSVKYLTVMLKNTFLAALCNALAVSENKVVMNMTAEGIQSLKNLTHKVEYCDGNGSVDYSQPEPSPTLTASPCLDECLRGSSPEFQASTTLLRETSESTEVDVLEIQPTKTASENNVKSTVFASGHSESRTIRPESGSGEYTATEYLSSTVSFTEVSDRGNGELNVPPAKEGKVSIADGKEGTQKDAEDENKNGNSVAQDTTTLESIIGDLNAIERVANSPSSLPTESIFLRLANRIKNLEINMSLSSTYLEEMSRRYRLQLELLSKSLNMTIQKVEEYSKAEEERDRRREKEMLLMRMQLANLTRDVAAFITEQNSWRPQASSVSQHVLFITVESLLIWFIFNYWKKSEENSNEKLDATKKLGKKLKRRSSLEGVEGHEVPRRKTRRPSEEALDIALSRTYRGEAFKTEKKRRRRKKDSKCSLNGFQPRQKVSEVEGFVGCFEDRSTPPFVPERPRCRSATRESESALSTSDGAAKTAEGFAVPSFMKTALAARNSRIREKESSQELNDAARKLIQKDRKGSNSIKKYMKKFF